MAIILRQQEGDGHVGQPLPPPPATSDVPAVAEWLIPPATHHEPQPPTGYVVSFTAFHEQGLGLPPSDFFRGLLHHYQVELHNLNPNGVMQMVVFVALCEGFLGILANFELWKYFLHAKVFLRTLKIPGDEKKAVPVRSDGCAIQLHQGRMAQYLIVKGSSSNKGWHSGWFYLRNNDRLLPRWTGKTVGRGRAQLGCQHGLQLAIEWLKEEGLTGEGVFALTSQRQVLPLMRRLRCLDEMVPGAPWKGTAMAPEPLSPAITIAHASDVLDGVMTEDDFHWLPSMRPDTDFVPLVILLTISLVSVALAFPLLMFSSDWYQGKMALVRGSLPPLLTGGVKKGMSKEKALEGGAEQVARQK